MGYERDYGRGNRSPYQRDGRDDRPGRSYDRDQDRGFLERAGDEIRSWFGDDEPDRRHDYDERMAERYERERFGRGDGGRASRYAGRTPQEGRTRGGYNPMAGDYGRRGPRETGDYPERHPRGGYGEQDYDRWRREQISSLDRDYDEYRRENQSRFDSEFSAWRSKRQTQRSCLQRVAEHMEVLGSDGEQLGTVDCVRGDHLILAKGDASAGGHHHSIPSLWIDDVDDKVRLTKTTEDARRQWRDEDRSQALFHDDDDRSEGPHMLNRSFSGTY